MFKKHCLNFFFNHAKLAEGRHRARRVRLFSRILKTFSGCFLIIASSSFGITFYELRNLFSAQQA